MKHDKEKQFEAFKKMEESYISNTLTLVSIIEGVALVILVERANDLIKDNLSETHTISDWVIHLSYILVSFSNIIVTTYMYVSQLSIFRRNSTSFDVVFPFMIGAAQIIQYHFFYDLQYWWISMSVLFLLASYAFKMNRNLIRTYAEKSNLPVYYNKVLHDLLKNFRFLTVFALLYGVGYGSMTILLFVKDVPPVVPALLLIPIFLANISTIIFINKSTGNLVRFFKSGEDTQPH